MKTTSIFLVLTILFILLSLFIPVKQLCSQNNRADSLKQILSVSEMDTNYVKTCLDLAWLFMYSETDSATVYANKGIDAAKKINHPFMLANSYNALGVTHIVQGRYSEAISALKNGVDITRRLLENEPDNKRYKRRILALYANIGNVHYYKGEYSKAIDNYIKSLNYSNQINYTPGKANCLSNIGASYKDLLNFGKALEYNYKSLALALQTKDDYLISQSLNNLGATYYSVPNYDSARYYFTQSTKRFEKENNEYELINSYVNMGDVYRHLGKFDTALVYYNKALNISTKLGSTDGLINVYYMLGELYDSTQQYHKSVAHLNKSLELARQTGTSRFIMLNHEMLAKVYVKLDDYKEAYNHFYQSSIIRDSIFNEERDKSIAEMETRFRTKEKEEEIQLLLKENALNIAKSQNRQILFVSVVIILLLLLLAVIFAYVAYKNKQKAARSQLQQKAEKKVLNAVVQTEFKERKRFAEELHDSMGALLSTLKLYINELGDTNNVEEKQKLLNRANELLDETIGNARSISHKIMPASIKEQGLEYALRSLIEKINASGKIVIEFETVGVQKHYEEMTELSIYRMLLEMINNTLKHANASKIEISLIHTNNNLYLTYSDNGVGFDIKDALHSSQEGIGLTNILSRIEIIGGKYHLNSQPGKGFTADIEIPV